MGAATAKHNNSTFGCLVPTVTLVALAVLASVLSMRRV